MMLKSISAVPSIQFPDYFSNSISVKDDETLPWTQSINPDRTLSYMPMLQIQLQLIKSMGMKEVKLEEKFTHRSSDVKPARIGNMCFTNEIFRKVRMTYFDAGDNVQVKFIF
jgi:hypothetical protein